MNLYSSNWLSPRLAFEATKSGAVILDIREKAFAAYKQFDVAELLYCPFSLIDINFRNFPKSKILIIADTSGLYARDAFSKLQGYGLRNLAILAGGIIEWERDGFPIIENFEERLTGTCVCMLRPRDKK